jgi:hypothetical protein
LNIYICDTLEFEEFPRDNIAEDRRKDAVIYIFVLHKYLLVKIGANHYKKNFIGVLFIILMGS